MAPRQDLRGTCLGGEESAARVDHGSWEETGEATPQPAGAARGAVGRSEAVAAGGRQLQGGEELASGEPAFETQAASCSHAAQTAP